MDLLAILPLGFLVGMGHALEADHLAAVATMLNDRGSRLATILRGAFWGLGHTLALFAICTVVILFGLSISHRTEALLEITVGLMIVLLGLHLLWTLRRNKVHLHAHSHGGATHLHVHAHAAGPGHDVAPTAGRTAPGHPSMRGHRHIHRNMRGNLKAMAIGLMHGAAGSAGLLVLVVAATSTLAEAMAYFAVFGAGSILGMAAISAVASYPLRLLHQGGRWMRAATGVAIALGAIYVGGSLVWRGYGVIAPAPGCNTPAAPPPASCATGASAIN